MEDSLLELASGLDDASLRLLLATSLSSEVKRLAGTQHFWYLRTKKMLAVDIPESNMGCWKNAYQEFRECQKVDRYVDMSNPIVVLILLFLDEDEWVLLKLCIEKDYSESVELLLNQEIDPSANDNYAIRLAVSMGSTSTTRLLLSDKRVNPSVKNNFCLRLASAYGYIDIVKLLLEDSRVDPRALDDYSLKISRRMGHREVERLLASIS